MRWGILFALMLSLLGPQLAAAPRKAAPAPKVRAGPQLMQSCDAHKFETVVDAVVDGEPRQSKVKLCGVKGQSDGDWIKTLRDAIAKLAANKDMAPATREQIVTAIKAEIARLSIEGGAAQAQSKAAEAAPMQPLSPLSRDYSALPPLPPPRETPAVPLQKDFAVLPPLPVAPPPATAAPKLVPMDAPRLTFGCDSPADLTTDASCAAFERETMLTVHAGDDVAPGILLQFVRNGRAQAEVPLEGLRRGGKLRMPLPSKVCSGFTSGKLELRIVHSAAGSLEDVLASDGPYSLRC
jgi:hypothetical protein